MRAAARWNKKDKVRTVEETAGALGVTGWRIAAQGVLGLENEGFQTDTQSQRLDVITEFAAFLVEAGVDSISLNPDSVLDTVQSIAEAEAGLASYGEETE